MGGSSFIGCGGKGVSEKKNMKKSVKVITTNTYV